MQRLQRPGRMMRRPRASSVAYRVMPGSACGTEAQNLSRGGVQFSRCEKLITRRENPVPTGLSRPSSLSALFLSLPAFCWRLHSTSQSTSPQCVFVAHRSVEEAIQCKL